MKNTLIAALFALASVNAFAHEGHHTQTNLVSLISHAFSHPGHWLVLVAFIAVAGGASYLFFGKQQKVKTEKVKIKDDEE